MIDFMIVYSYNIVWIRYDCYAVLQKLRWSAVGPDDHPFY